MREEGKKEAKERRRKGGREEGAKVGVLGLHACRELRPRTAFVEARPTPSLLACGGRLFISVPR